MVPVEAMASGRPVIAFGRGGATETVATGVSGVFFAEQSVEAISSAVREPWRHIEIDPERIAPMRANLAGTNSFKGCAHISMAFSPKAGAR